MRTPTGKLMPVTMKKNGKTYSRIFCCWTIGLFFAVSGINFPIGVLIYWFTTNLWSMGQQFWVIRNNPQPGTPAFAAKEARQAAKTAANSPPEIESIPDPDAVSDNVNRVQPKKQSRSQRKKK